MAVSAAADLPAICEFLYHEAALLEEGRLEQWVALFTGDCLYWVPSNSLEVDPQKAVSIAYDDAARLRERVSRLKSGSFWAQDPPSRTTRVVGNIRVAESAGDECSVESRLILVELRRGASRTYSGKMLHTLRRVEGQWRIRQKIVHLIQNNEPIQNLTFLV
jgi:3-phenylpropionate/cinnamic acid dioxygenase small subunit